MNVPEKRKANDREILKQLQDTIIHVHVQLYRGTVHLQEWEYFYQKPLIIDQGTGTKKKGYFLDVMYK